MAWTKTASRPSVFSNWWTRFNAYRQAHPRLFFLCTFLFFFAPFYFYSWKNLDPDFGWHLKAGTYFRRYGIPSHDVFTYTAQSFRWIDHEWGNDVMVSTLYGLGGYALVAVPYALLWSGAIMLAGRRARFWALLLAATAVLPYAGVRTVAWSTFFLAVTLRIVAAAKRRPNLTWLLPPLFIVWANVHAGFIIGLLVILYLALYQRRWKLLPVWGLSVLATFINAYGPRLYVEIARTLFDPTLHSQVAEWSPFLIKLQTIPFLTVWAAGALMYALRPMYGWLRPSILMLAGGLSASRNIPFFVVAAVVELDTYLGRMRAAIPKRLDHIRRVVLLALILFIAVIVGNGLYQSFTPLTAGREARYPAAAVVYLQNHGCEGGHLFNDYNYGGYLVWRLPSQKVFIDGRMPSWRDPSGHKYLTQYYALLAHPASYHHVFQQYNIHCSILIRSKQNQKFIARLHDDGWQTALETPGYILQMAP